MLNNYSNNGKWREDIVWDNTVEFTFTANAETTFDLFNANTLTNVPTSNFPPPQDFYISSGSTVNYNQFVRDTLVTPKLIRRITIISDTASYLTQPLNMVYRDANGNYCSVPKIVNNYFSVNQYQTFINVEMQPMEMILDNNTIISQYNFPASSSVKFVMYYKEIKRTDLLSSYGTQISDVSIDLSEPTFTEKEMKLMNAPKWFDIGDYLDMRTANPSSKKITIEN